MELENHIFQIRLSHAIKKITCFLIVCFLSLVIYVQLIIPNPENIIKSRLIIKDIKKIFSKENIETGSSPHGLNILFATESGHGDRIIIGNPSPSKEHILDLIGSNISHVRNKHLYIIFSDGTGSNKSNIIQLK